MLQAIAKWLLSLLQMGRELQETRDELRRLQTRVRDLEEILRLTIQESRSDRALEKSEREKFVMRMERLNETKSLSRAKPRGRKKKS